MPTPSLAVSGGTLNIAKCYEGLESKTIDISGGSIDLTASDDGFNAPEAPTAPWEAGG